MAFGELTRIGSNLGAAQSLRSLKLINGRIGEIQSRLSTGKRIVRVQDDTAGYQIAKGLESRVRGLKQAFDNVGTAKNVLNVSESNHEAQMSLLLSIKDKVSQASDEALTSTQTSAIQNQIDAMLTEIDDLKDSAQWQGTALNGGSSPISLTFHVGDGADDNFTVTLNGFDSSTVGLIEVSSTASALIAIGTVETAIDTLASGIQAVGNYQIRLGSKEGMLSDSIMNTEAARSRIEDADFAIEQMEALKLQVMQQTSMTAFTQANSAPQLVLSLFR
ncbi:MAG: flagellin [Candidatus Marinimicrobia bacterium]|jgi:flagellin|nr:flagellin [Candidatus Neomarinimicrobiota bacterium]MBT3633281.1 flagellin [Candidatus Neomarinimicrobiota bacterium]MBT3681424.1 flagellin [Candidatus Neomarinimicrobiota bacterium]MBT3758609.1 flagellin [Candidatus Neomarinimicrobiota bacterium]MBT3894737.1 flagellin [Candidatus Neomarinimicrobiota bacterium]